MIKVFIPQPKIKSNKPNIRGFWKSDTGEIFYDYLKVYKYPLINEGLYYNKLFNDYLTTLKIAYNQEAIFYIKDNEGYCYTSSDSIDILPLRLEFRHSGFKGLKGVIQRLLNEYGGATVYKTAEGYLIDVFTKQGI
jgi:hypothetical protein